MKVLFVCTGNVCRSAMGHALLAHKANEAGIKLAVVSAGTEAATGDPATDLAVEVLQQRGVGLQSHQSRPLTTEVVRDADLIVAMTRRHEATIVALDQEARPRTFLAGELIRLGGARGPVGEHPPELWVASLHEARGGHMTTGRLADEIPDPWGEPIDVYRQTADRLDGLTSALARLLAS
jgi:protein-tyrosine phosphatase